MAVTRRDSFWGELKRRKVVRVAVAYLGVASIMLEVTDNLFEVLVLGGYQRPLVIAVAAGFPIVLVLAWLFDLTSKGVELTPQLPPEGEVGAGGTSARFTRQLVVSGALVVLAMTGVGWRYMPNDRVDFDEHRVAVAPFTNDTEDPELDIVGVIVARELGRNLEQLEGLVIDMGDQLAGIPAAQGEETQSSSGPAPSPLHALAERTRAGLVVSGSYYRAGDDLVLRAEVYDAERQERIFTGEPVQADPDDLMAGIAQLQEEGLLGFMAGMGGGVAVLERTAALQTRAPNYAAYKEFARALELIATRPFPGPQLLAHVDSAVSLDSSFVGALNLSAYLHLKSGDREGAQPRLDRLESLRGELTPYERAGLGRNRALAAGDREGVYGATKTIVDLIGTSMAYYLAGEAALDVNRPNEARDYLLQYDRDRIPHPAIYQMLARANHQLGSHRAELRLVEEMYERFPRIMTLPFLRIPEMGALAAVGRGTEALERLSSFELDDAGPGTFIGAAEELEAHGDPGTARIVRQRLLEREEAIPEDERPRGDRCDDRDYLCVRGRILASLGRSEEASAIFQGLVEDNPGNEGARIEAALIAARTGDGAYAEETISWLGERLAPRPRGSVFQARIAAALGDAERAVRFLRQAEAAGHVDFLALHVHPAYEPIRDHPAFKDYMKPRDSRISWLPGWLRL